jgi:hypothetical protein
VSGAGERIVWLNYCVTQQHHNNLIIVVIVTKYLSTALRFWGEFNNTIVSALHNTFDINNLHFHMIWLVDQGTPLLDIYIDERCNVAHYITRRELY